MFDWRDILTRAGLTFGQAFIAVVVAAGTNYVNTSVWKAASLAGGAALFSFGYNVLKQRNAVV